jgi:hypothetical protein
MCYLNMLVTGLTISMLLSAQSGPQVSVYKTSTCGCCRIWVEHLKKNGFTVTATDVPNIADYRKKYGVPEGLQSCHTAIVDGYTIEGHVPAADIHRLLKSRVKAKGLAVPGMPLGSPGMESSRRDPYAVMLFDSQGKASVYQKYPGD